MPKINNLTTEIVFYLLDNIFGLINPRSFSQKLSIQFLNKTFTLPQQLSFTDEELDQSFNFPIWGATTSKDGLVFQFIFTRTIIETEIEYFFLFQIDDHPPCALKGLQNKDQKIGIITYLINGQWMLLDILSQAKVLSSIEQLSCLLLEWNPLVEPTHTKMYQHLLTFVNFSDQHAT